MEIIPHRPPFLLLDEVTEMEIGKSVTAKLHVAEDMWFFNGHFPGKPYMPGVLIVEALAQAGAVAVLAMPENKGKIGLLAGVNNAKFKKSVQPLTDLTLCVEITAMRASIGKGNATAYINGEVCCKCEITFAFSKE